MRKIKELHMLRFLFSRAGYTLGSEIQFEGISLMGGQNVKLRLIPLFDRAGINIRASGDKAWERIDESHVVDALGRTTMVRTCSGSVMLVEHLMAALKGMGIDHVGLELEGQEIPILDGSSLPFVKEFVRVGRVKTDHEVAVYEVIEPLSLQDGQSAYVVAPLLKNQDRACWHCIIDYTTTSSIGLQKFDYEDDRDIFLREISPCRTFCLMQELDLLRSKGLAKGGSLENAVVFDGSSVLNAEGLRFHDEPVRHKLLDLIGDLALLDVDLRAHITAMRPSHRGNNALARMIRKCLP